MENLTEEEKNKLFKCIDKDKLFENIDKDKLFENIDKDKLFEIIDKDKLFEYSKTCIIDNIFKNYDNMKKGKIYLFKKAGAHGVKDFIKIYQHFDNVNMKTQFSKMYNEALKYMNSNTNTNTSTDTLISAGKSKRRRNKKRSCTKRRTKR